LTAKSLPQRQDPEVAEFELGFVYIYISFPNLRNSGYSMQMQINKNELADLLHLAESSALLAGRQLKLHQEDWCGIIAEQGRDVKVKADKLAENLILAQLQSATSFPILTEETGWHKGTDAKRIWVVDPLDGSFNYSQQIPFCCVAIALVEEQEPIIGVIYDFNHDELFSGSLEEGAFLNYHLIHVSPTSNIKSAVLNTGFPARTDHNTSQKIIDYGQSFRKVRMLGSAALSLAYVAAGRAEVYQEQGTMFWDVAAGCALVKAAGGICEMHGDIFNAPINCIASNGKIIVK
jgi:myo-inositol-1(or 4)-monophosphatase